MGYFSWILRLGAALAFGVIKVLRLESAYAFGARDEAAAHKRFRSWSGDVCVPAAPVAA